jgi:capsular polysaccharide biosynthesis protein
MELRLYLSILRRRWWVVAGLPLLVALVSGAAALTRPPRYEVTARLLVTRGTLPGSAAGLTDQGEDKTAQDLPAIVSGAPFARDVAQELARQGSPIDAAAVVEALQSWNQDHVVFISAAAARSDDAGAIARAAVAMIQANGLRYWGEPRATVSQPGLNVAVLSLPDQAELLNGPRALAQEVLLRALLGLAAGIGIAFALHYFHQGQLSTSDQTAYDTVHISR